MGYSVPEADIYYPLAMLAARFIAFGMALIYISNAPVQHKLWINIFVLIQVIDLAAGIFYAAIGVVPLSFKEMIRVCKRGGVISILVPTYGFNDEKLEGLIESIDVSDRSEERRVGKECRSRWSPDH